MIVCDQSRLYPSSTMIRNDLLLMYSNRTGTCSRYVCAQDYVVTVYHQNWDHAETDDLVFTYSIIFQFVNT